MRFFYTLIILLLLNSSNVFAGVHSDALGKCLIDSTSTKDKNTLIVWMFSAASQHPLVSDIVSVNEVQLNKANKEFADLTMKLLTVDCQTETKMAVKQEGIASLQSSFKVFGEATAQDLLSSPYVVKAMAGYVQYLDIIKLGLMFR